MSQQNLDLRESYPDRPAAQEAIWRRSCTWPPPWCRLRCPHPAGDLKHRTRGGLRRVRAPYQPGEYIRQREPLQTSLATEVVIASSDPVLAGALPKVSPPTNSLQALGNRISVAALGGSDVLSITATGKTAGQAENTANAVANSYIAYVSALDQPRRARGGQDGRAGDNRDRGQAARAHRHIRHLGRTRRSTHRFRHLLGASAEVTVG